jgi:hypothetical protein
MNHKILAITLPLSSCVTAMMEIEFSQGMFEDIKKISPESILYGELKVLLNSPEEQTIIERFQAGLKDKNLEIYGSNNSAAILQLLAHLSTWTSDDDVLGLLEDIKKLGTDEQRTTCPNIGSENYKLIANEVFTIGRLAELELQAANDTKEKLMTVGQLQDALAGIDRDIEISLSFLPVEGGHRGADALNVPFIVWPVEDPNEKIIAVRLIEN